METGSVKLDGLPYIENYEYLRPQVEKLIEDEMQRYPPTKNYLSHLSEPNFTFKSPILQEEFKRVQEGRPMQPVDQTHYDKPIPKTADPKAWQEALECAELRLEHQILHLINLELLNNYGANAWKIYNQNLIFTKQLLIKHLDTVKAEILLLNKHRKSEQITAGTTLSKLESKWQELIVKNIEIDNACQKLEQEILQLKLDLY